MTQSNKEQVSPEFRVIAALVGANLVSVLLFVARAVESQSIRYWFLLWNLALAWVPLLIVWWLWRSLRTRRWMSWQNIGLTLIWLGFLPNSFYIVSDLIHLHPTGEVSHLYDAVMFSSFIFSGFAIGLLGVLLVHRALLRRLSRRVSHALIGLIFFACGFAIYLGRNMRWNTWDVLVNPAGILFDISERVIKPASDEQAFVTTMLFFLLLSSVYMVVWQMAVALRQTKDRL